MNTTVSRIIKTAIVAAMTVLAPWALAAEELLRGEFTDADGQRRVFRVTGESAEEIVGGSLQLGDAEFVIAKQSRLGLIGAARFSKGDREFGEYAVLSSSFSDLTATGQPWVKARKYVGCEEDYNTFVAVYRVYGVDRVNALGASPYGTFTDDLDAADESVVYCLYSSGAPRGPGGAALSEPSST